MVLIRERYRKDVQNSVLVLKMVVFKNLCHFFKLVKERNDKNIDIFVDGDIEREDGIAGI